MIKRTLLFSNPYYLSVKNNQLVINPKNNNEDAETTTSPIEDIGFIIVDHPQTSISIPVLEELQKNNVGVIFCDNKHKPISMLLNLDSHHLQSELFSAQIEAPKPLLKQLWKQTVEAKILNQINVLKSYKKPIGDLLVYKKQVKSGDSSNREACAAKIYWRQLFPDSFRRDRFGEHPNNFLNYGYAILRAATARALTGSGLLPTLGIHHHNRYNAFCLADDIMEPYRPYVDDAVLEITEKFPEEKNLNKEIKAKLLSLLSCDVSIGENRRPLMIALSQTTASLARCYAKTSKKIDYPIWRKGVGT